MRYYLVALPVCGKCKGKAVYVIEDADHNPVAHVCAKHSLPTLQELNDGAECAAAGTATPPIVAPLGAK